MLSLLAGLGTARAGAPFLTDDPVPTDYGHWEVYLFSQATHVRGDANGILPGIEINYGAAPELQLHLVVQRAFDKPDGVRYHFGPGDTEFGAKYRLAQEDPNGWRPGLAIFPTISAPTGDSDQNLGTGRAHAFLPVWLGKTFGDWQTNAGGGFGVNPGSGNQNYWFAGWQVQRKVTDQLTLGGELFYQTSPNGGGSDTTGYNLGAIYDISANHHLMLSAGSGLQNATANNEFSYYAAYLLTF